MPDRVMPDRDGIADLIRQVVQGRDDLVAVYLFGSVAEGTAHGLSDVDVAVLFRPNIPSVALFARVLAIGSALEAALPMPVDLIDLGQAGPALAFQVLRKGWLIVERDRDARSLFVMCALGRYYDARPYLDYQNAQLLARVRRGDLGRGYNGDHNALSEARRLSQKLAAASGRAKG